MLTDLLDDTPTAAPPPTLPTLAVTVPLSVLRPLLDRVVTAVPTRDVMEVLKHVQLTASAGRLTLTATDMDLGLRASTDEVKITRAGTAVMPAKRLVEMLRTAADDLLVLNVHGGHAALTAGRTGWRLRVPTGADFPTLPVLDEAVIHTTDRVRFAAALLAVRYAAGTESYRPALAAVELRAGKATACDGTRFAQARTDPALTTVTIPTAAVDRIIKLCTAAVTDDCVDLSVTDRYIGVRVGDTELIATKLLLPYPDLDAALLRPALTNKHPLRVDRDLLRTAITRVRLAADPDTCAVALHLARDRIAVAGRDPHGNTAVDHIPAGWSGAERTLVVHHRHLADLITHHPSGDLTFMLGEDTKTRRSSILLRAEHEVTVGVVQQMHIDWPEAP